MGREYVVALRESLQKKLKVLEEIYSLSLLQRELFSADEMDYEAFDRYFDDKDICIEKLNGLDEGFELLYNRVKDEIEANKDAYADEIRLMQDLIRSITEKSTSIQALEERNRKSMEECLAKDRKQAKEGKRSVSVAMNYYRQMNGMSGASGSAKLDKKK